MKRYTDFEFAATLAVSFAATLGLLALAAGALARATN